MKNVTKTFLPPFEEYIMLLKRAWDKSWITNNGELVQELEEKLKEYLGVEHFLFCANGTIVLQMALKVFGITKEVITTPFSYVATTNAILWEGCTPVFVDIRPDTLCIDETKIEAAITENTQAILATHVYGNPCNVEAIYAIAKKYNLKVIYDGAHAFGCKLNGRSLLDYGDITTCSFHATKLFHTGEGGGIIVRSKEFYDKLYLLRSFGHIGDDYFSIGINGKNSEFHAAMGLAILNYITYIIDERKRISELYSGSLSKCLERPSFDSPEFIYNYAYYPVIFKTEANLLASKDILMKNSINARRYFYPSLNLLPHLQGQANKCPISEDISRRVLSLPLYPGFNDVEQVNNILKGALG